MAVSEQRVTRGRLLKRAGVGAAALGAGSMLTASTAGASFSSIFSTACIAVGGCSTTPFVDGCDSGCQCGCVVTPEGCCFCAENWFCNTPACTKSSQCPPGWGCGYSPNCGGFVCAPHCGSCNHHTVCCNTAPVKPTGKTAFSK